MALKGFLGKPVLDSGEAMGDVWCVAWRSAHFFFFKGGKRNSSSSCGAQMRNKRNQSPARVVKHSPQGIVYRQTGITAASLPPAGPLHPPLTTLSHTGRQKVWPPPAPPSLQHPPHLLPASSCRNTRTDFHYLPCYSKPPFFKSSFKDGIQELRGRKSYYQWLKSDNNYIDFKKKFMSKFTPLISNFIYIVYFKLFFLKLSPLKTINLTANSQRGKSTTAVVPALKINQFLRPSKSLKMNQNSCR